MFQRLKKNFENKWLEKNVMKEHVKEILNSFFISVTLINIAMFILGILFRPEQRFGYEAYLYPLIY